MMDRFQQAFQEEARELLAELEAALLEMDQNPDAETVGRAFRALHTIKGSGAMFGFDQLAGFAHELETAFDRLRNGQLAVSPPLINLTLAAADQMKSMLEEAVGGTPADPERGRQILVELQRLMGSDGGTGSQTAAVSAPLRSGAEGPPRVWHVRFRPGPEVILHGTNPLVPGTDLALPMAPTIATRGGKPVLALGTPGSYGICQTQTQALVQHVDFGLPLQEAIEAPRARLWNGRRVQAEDRLPAASIEALKERGHEAEPLPPWSILVGGMQGIVIDPDSGALVGGADPRREGYVAIA